MICFLVLEKRETFFFLEIWKISQIKKMNNVGLMSVLQKLDIFHNFDGHRVFWIQKMLTAFRRRCIYTYIQYTRKKEKRPGLQFFEITYQVYFLTFLVFGTILFVLENVGFFG